MLIYNNKGDDRRGICGLLPLLITRVISENIFTLQGLQQYYKQMNKTQMRYFNQILYACWNR